MIHRGVDGAKTWLRGLSLWLRLLTYLAALSLAFVAALAVGAGATVVLEGQQEPVASAQDDSGAVAGDGAEDPASDEGKGGSGEDDDEPAPVAQLVHRATDANSRGDYTYLSDPSLDGNPNALVLAAPAADEGTAGDGAYDHNIGVWYEAQAGKWAVFNQDLAAVPAGTAYRVVVPRDDRSFVHRFTAPDGPANESYIDDPLVNGRPEAELTVTPSWNPGGGTGVYNDHPVGVRYDAGRERWVIFNEDLAVFRADAAFNVSVSGVGPT